MTAMPGHGALLIIMDDTAAYEAERAKAQTDRLASIGFMLAGVCHEVSNPLAATYSMVQLLESQSGLTDQMYRSGLAKISANVRRILDVSRTVYEFARVSELKPLPIDLPIEEAFDLLASDSRFADVDVVHKPDYGAVIEGDLVHLRQVFFNLALNAAQAMRGHGDITVTTEHEPSGRIIVVFEDSGPGIDRDYREKVFEPFFTTKPSGKGVGLGLSIVRDVMREHGGTIGIEDGGKGGARFVLVFPNGSDPR
jgi:signal transduction histidine kinase